MLKIAQRRAFAIGAAAFVMLGITLPASAQSPIIVSPDGKYLGNLNSNPYDPNSVSNPYGRYGSPYSADSINNPYGVYGSPYSTQSPNNPYALGAQRHY